MKNTFVIIFILVLSTSNAQEFVKDTSKYARYKLEIGVLVPIGNLKSKIGVSEQFGFWYRTRIEHNDLMDFGFNIVIPENKNSFIYRGNDSTFIVKPKGITVMVACRMNKLYGFNLLNKKVTLEWRTTFGGSFFSFEDKENPENTSGHYTDENGVLVYRVDTNTKALSCIYAAQGLIFRNKNVGVEIDYNFTPYSWFTNRIDSDFGKSSLSIKLSCFF